MKVAIIGTGIAGNYAAYRLHKEHDITVFESNDYVGGHTHTHDISVDGNNYAIDTGFIVFNDRTYPHFSKLLQDLNVDVQASEMSFSVKSSDLEYKGSSLNTLFAQRSNLLKPKFHKMIADILRFNKKASQFLLDPVDISLAEFLRAGNYSPLFINYYIVPMGAAIWSTDPATMRDFPAIFFIRFFQNHGLLTVKDQPQWQVIKGGSQQYVKALIRAHKNKIHLSSPVTALSRNAGKVQITTLGQGQQQFDAVFIASHSDQALQMITDPSLIEQEVLGAIKYQPNEAVLHTDSSLLPKRKLAWGAWNYHVGDAAVTQSRASLTYNMNILQSLDSAEPFCVTLNNTASIDESKILKRIDYHHPVYTPASVAAQQRQAEINTGNNTYFCGAYWGNGFHEDGVLSAIKALDHFTKNHRDG